MSKRRDRRRREQRQRGGKRNGPKGLFYVTDEPLDVGVPAEVEDEIPDLFEGLRNAPAKTLQRVEELIAKYPDLPMLHNYRATALAQLGQVEGYREAVDANFRRFPDYLFARVNFAESLLLRGDPESVAAIPGIFGGNFDLRKMYPHRTVFHTSEFASVSFVQGSYLLAMGDLEGAEQRLELMEEVAPAHRGTAELRKLVLGATVRAGLERFRLWRKKRKQRNSNDPSEPGGTGPDPVGRA